MHLKPAHTDTFLRLLKTSASSLCFFISLRPHKLDKIDSPNIGSSITSSSSLSPPCKQSESLRTDGMEARSANTQTIKVNRKCFHCFSLITISKQIRTTRRTYKYNDWTRNSDTISRAAERPYSPDSQVELSAVAESR